MRAVLWRGVVARRLRSALVAVAVVLGVTMIAGTLVLTDTVNRAFATIFSTASVGVDLQVAGRQDFGAGRATPPPFAATVLDRVRAVPGVAFAGPQIADQEAVRLLAPGDGPSRPFSDSGPTFALSVGDPRFGRVDYREGGPAERAGDVVLDRQTARRAGLRLGSTVAFATPTGVARFRLAGIATFGELEGFGSASFAGFTLADAQRITGKTGRLDAIQIEAEPGTDVDALRGAVQAAVPATLEVKTGRQQADDQTAAVGDQIGFVTTALLVFGVVALIVGGFVIFNTFTITVAQRSREFAVLRVLGASRSQLLGGVLAEALAVGVAGSVVGVAAGYGFALGARAVLSATGFELPAVGTVLAARTVVASLAVGIAVTVAAGLVPALRATRVAPVVAMSEGLPVLTRRRRPLLAGAGLLLAGVGAALVADGVLVDRAARPALAWIGAGTGVLLIALAALTPTLVAPLVRAIGAPLTLGRPGRQSAVSGRIARDNAARNPVRTGVTAAALMIGLALCVLVAMLAASISSSVDATIDRTFAGDLTLRSTDGFTPLPAGAVVAAAETPGVAVASPLTSATARLGPGGGPVRVRGIDPATLGRVYRFGWTDGSDATLAALGPRDAVVEARVADRFGLRVGGQLRATTPSGRTVEYTVRGIYRDTALLTGFAAPLATVAADFGDDKANSALLKVADGTPVSAVAAALAVRLRADFPTVEAQSQAQLKASQRDRLAQVLVLIYALLALSVLVSVLGVVNTLALSLHERVREIGMLRAVGTTRRQVGAIVVGESTIISAIGATLGLAAGVGLATAVTYAFRDDGLEPAVPVVTLVVLAAGALVAGVAAAAVPARTAARVDLLEALSVE